MFLAAVLLRVIALDRPPGFTGDERMHVPNARTYAEHGHLGPDNWYHPPLKHLVTYAAIHVIGDDPWGWRLRNAILGAGSAALLFLLGAALLESTGAALLAAALMALDPLHVTMSRSTFEDVPAVFFVLAALLFSVRRARGGGWGALLGAGISFGLAIAFRTYALAPALASATVLGAIALRQRRPAELLAIAASFVVIPFAIYLAAFAPWFERGYGFGEWLELQCGAFAAATTASAGGFNPALMALGRPWRWFVVPVGVAFPLPAGGIQAVLNDPPIWILILPALATLSVAAIRARRWELAVIPAAFAVLYAPFLIAARPIFLYSSLAVLPFGFLALGWAASRLPVRWAATLGAGAAIWSLCLYPLAVGAPVSASLYGPVLEWMAVLGGP